MVRINSGRLSALLLLLLSATAWAGSAEEPIRSLEISVVDAEGLPMAGAVTTLQRGGDRGPALLANEEGKSSFRPLLCDLPYSLNVTFPGYISRTVAEIRPCEPPSASLVVCLDRLRYEEILLDRSRPPLIDIESTRVSTVYTPRFLQDLPGVRGDPSVGRRAGRKAKNMHKGCDRPFHFISSSSTP
jgi:hypothetical protein